MSEPTSSVAVTLQDPILRESGKVETLTLRKPRSGELRGLQLSDIMSSDATAIMTLLPRISDPFITPQEAADLDPADFAELAGTVVGFFMTAAQKTMIAQMTGG